MMVRAETAGWSEWRRYGTVGYYTENTEEEEYAERRVKHGCANYLVLDDYAVIAIR